MWSERIALQVGGGPKRSVVANPGLGSAHAHFTQPFFRGVEHALETIAELGRCAPHDRAEILARAQDVASGHVAVFGHGLVHVGNPPQWTHEPIAGLTAPSGHWSTIPFLNPAIVGDHKVVWEINRHQQFITLGQAWLYTSDDQWPKVFVQQLRSWIVSNPPSAGMNWASSLEVSYRAISWLWALRLMRDSELVDATVQSELLHSLEAHGRHLSRFLSTYFSPNTHLTGEALGLFYIGTQCPDLRDAKTWAALGADILEKALAFQVLPDGVYFEQASQYHRYTIEIYLHYLLLAQANARSVGHTVLPALNRLFDVLLHLTRNDGTIPLIGDDDGGRLLPVDIRPPHDVRSLLAIGAVVLDRSDLAWLGRGDDAMLCWTLGAESVAIRDALIHEPPADRAKAFSNGGIYIIREGWSHDDGHMAIDSGPHGALSFGHSHADALSIELSVGGDPLFVDAGTFTYVGKDRNTFRVTSAHNTVEIDGESACQPGTAFRWNSVTHPEVTEWVADASFTLFSGSQNGYASLTSPVRHTRVVLHPATGVWIILDEVQASASHDVAVRWRCAPGLQAELVSTHPGGSVIKVAHDSAPRALLAFSAGSLATLSVEEGFASPQYGLKVPVHVCVGREKISGNASMVSVVLDWRLFEFAELPAGGAFAQQDGSHRFAVRSLSDGSMHTVLVGAPATPAGTKAASITFGNMQIEATLAWVSTDSSNAACGVTAVGVRQLSVDGASLLHNPAANRWAVATRELEHDNKLWKLRTQNSSTRA